MIFVMPGGSKRKRDSVGEHLRCAVNRVKKSLALTILRNVCGQLSNPGLGFSSPPVENIKEKSPYFRTGSHLEYGGEGGIDSLRSPLRGSPLTACAVCPTGVASCRTLVGGSHPPQRVPHAKKKPVHAYELFLKYGGEGGLTRFARPCGAARLLRARSVQLAAPVVEPRSGVLIPPCGEYKRKEPVLSYRLSSRIWR